MVVGEAERGCCALLFLFFSSASFDSGTRMRGVQFCMPSLHHISSLVCLGNILRSFLPRPSPSVCAKQASFRAGKNHRTVMVLYGTIPWGCAGLVMICRGSLLQLWTRGVACLIRAPGCGQSIWKPTAFVHQSLISSTHPSPRIAQHDTSYLFSSSFFLLLSFLSFPLLFLALLLYGSCCCRS